MELSRFASPARMKLWEELRTRDLTGPELSSLCLAFCSFIDKRGFRKHVEQHRRDECIAQFKSMMVKGEWKKIDNLSRSLYRYTLLSAFSDPLWLFATHDFYKKAYRSGALTREHVFDLLKKSFPRDQFHVEFRDTFDIFYEVTCDNVQLKLRPHYKLRHNDALDEVCRLRSVPLNDPQRDKMNIVVDKTTYATIELWLGVMISSSQKNAETGRFSAVNKATYCSALELPQRLVEGRGFLLSHRDEKNSIFRPLLTGDSGVKYEDVKLSVARLEETKVVPFTEKSQGEVYLLVKANVLHKNPHEQDQHLCFLLNSSLDGFVPVQYGRSSGMFVRPMKNKNTSLRLTQNDVQEITKDVSRLGLLSG